MYRLNIYLSFAGDKPEKQVNSVQWPNEQVKMVYLPPPSVPQRLLVTSATFM